MSGSPSAVDLLEALCAYLREEAVPELSGATRFKALVAANVATIVAREIRLGPVAAKAEQVRLEALLGCGENDGSEATLAEQLRGLNHELVERIRRGDADAGPWRARVLDHLRKTVADRLAIDNPKLLAKPD